MCVTSAGSEISSSNIKKNGLLNTQAVHISDPARMYSYESFDYSFRRDERSIFL